MSPWLLIHTKIRQERKALENLERQGFECFLPLTRAERPHHGALEVVEEALFPRYLFVRPRHGLEPGSWEPIRSTAGVSRVVALGQMLATVDDELIMALRAKTSPAAMQLHHLEPGEAVALPNEPFLGMEAVYQMADGERRVLVMLDVLSKLMKMAVTPKGIRKDWALGAS